MSIKYSTQSFTLLLLLFCFALPSMSDTKTETGWHESSVKHDGVTRYFRYYVPSTITQHPDTLLLFHGGTQSMTKIFSKRAGGTQEWKNLADKNGFLLIVPNGINVKTRNARGNKQNWNDCRIGSGTDNASSTADDVGFVSDLLTWSKSHFDINESRVYATGASNGGLMTLRLVTELSNKITAAAVFIANQPIKTDCAQAEQAVPLFIMSATDDPLMLWNGGKIREKGPVLMSAKETLNYWLKVNRSDKAYAYSSQLPDLSKKDKSVVIKTIYPKSKNGEDLWHYEVRGGGHTMPSIKYKVPLMARMIIGSQNNDLEASHEAWNFLKRYTKK